MKRKKAARRRPSPLRRLLSEQLGVLKQTRDLLNRVASPSITIPFEFDAFGNAIARPSRFIQCWAVAGRPVTQALDDQGQVWERVWRKATATTPEESFWEPLSMERRDKVQKEIK